MESDFFDRAIHCSGKTHLVAVLLKVYMVQKQHRSPPLHDIWNNYFSFVIVLFSTMSSDLLREVMPAELK